MSQLERLSWVTVNYRGEDCTGRVSGYHEFFPHAVFIGFYSGEREKFFISPFPHGAVIPIKPSDEDLLIWALARMKY